MTLTCTTLDRHEHKNYLRPVFSFYALFDDMWCLLDFNSFPWYYNWPTAGIFCMRKKKKILMQMRLNATHVNVSLYYTVMFSLTYWPAFFLSNARQTQSWWPGDVAAANMPWSPELSLWRNLLISTRRLSSIFFSPAVEALVCELYSCYIFVLASNTPTT